MKKHTPIYRWMIVVAGVIVHLFLGTVYAWSFFQKNISEKYHWSQMETAWAFSLSIFMLGITAAWCGTKITKYGVKKLAMTGVSLYALGYIISYFALEIPSLLMLYIGFGVIGGIGLGMAYVTPVATVSSWFPDRQGLVTGIVVMGFGLGALVMSKFFAPYFLKWFDDDLSFTFLCIGILLLVFTLPAASLLEDKKNTSIQSSVIQEKGKISQYIFTKDYILLWLVFMFNIIAGMIFISFQSVLLQDILKDEGFVDTVSLEQKGATLIGISALCNGIGRFFWGSISDKIGRLFTLKAILFIEILVFTILILISNSLVFSVGVCIVLLCYGGGFGILPSLIKEKYGLQFMGTMYGITLTSWGIGGILGPQIIAYMKDNFSENDAVYSFGIGLILITIGFIFSFFIKKGINK